MKENAPLNASRGNRFGIGFFRLLMHCGGFGVALRFSRIVAWFYARFDRRAFSAAADYLKLRFPEDAGSEKKLRRHFHLLLNELAKMLLVSYRMGIGKALPIGEEDRKYLPETGGVVVVLAHFDCWQAAMDLMNRSRGRVINIMARADQVKGMDKFLALKSRSGFNVISTEGFSGGLVEASAALERGEAVIIMGDRPVPGAAAAEVPFFGGKIAVPLSPWMLAARNGVPAVPVFAELHEDPLKIVIRYCPPVPLPEAPGRRLRAEELSPAAAQYAQLLEEAAGRRPYRVFRFGGDVSRKDIEKDPCHKTEKIDPMEKEK
ncbi:MAG: lysophospholipid acyltransferase family protein [Lentisphaeria bacterium]|nr:lysophospholipid acyltransferase family protein [Lentisphaeria bacterium]